MKSLLLLLSLCDLFWNGGRTVWLMGQLASYAFQEGVKVVAKDGTLIHKTGLITGGQTPNVADQMLRWSGKQGEELRAEIELLQEELGGLPQTQVCQQEESKLLMEINTMTHKIDHLEKEMSTIVTAIESTVSIQEYHRTHAVFGQITSSFSSFDIA